MSVSRYRLYLSDYVDDGQRSQGCLYLGDRDETPDFVSRKLLASSQIFEKTWGMLFAPKQNVDVEMRVYGSEFAKRFFKAYGNKRIRDVGGMREGANVRLPFKYVEDDGAGGQRRIDDRGLGERLSCLKDMMEKHGAKVTLPSNVCLRINGAVEGIEEIVAKLNAQAEYMGILPVVYAVQRVDGAVSGVSDPETFRISVVSSCDEKGVKWTSLNPSENVIFRLDLDAPENDVLDPRQHADDGLLHYCWKFNEIDALVGTIKLYVESHVLSPKLTQVCNLMLAECNGGMDVPSLCTVLGCCRVFPFAVLEAPTSGVVEDDVVFKFRGFGASAEDLPAPGFQDAENVKRWVDTVSDPRCPVVLYSFRLDHVGSVVCSIPRKEKGLGAPRGWWSDVFVARVGDAVRLVRPETINASELTSEFQIRNHNLTTGFKISLNGRYDFTDGAGYCGAKDENYIEVIPENCYGGCEKPNDADAWNYEIEDDKGCVHSETRFENGQKLIKFVAPQRCTIKVTVARPDGNLIKTVAIHALGRAERIECEIKGDSDDLGGKPRIVKDAKGNIEVECFCGQTLTLYAKSIGSGDELWDASIEIPELNVRSYNEDPVIERKLSFKSAGYHNFTIRSRNEKAGLSCRVTILVKKDRSKLARSVMCGAVAIAGLHFFLIYGISWWMTFVYMVPIATFVLHFKKSYPHFRLLMRVLVALDVLMFVWSAIQEVS